MGRAVLYLGEGEMQDVGVEFGEGACESVAAQVITTELTGQKNNTTTKIQDRVTDNL